MARDVDLVLDSGDTIVADGNTDYIELEGGFLAWAHIYWGAMTGGSTTMDARVVFSVDAGANYYMAGKFQQLGPTNDNAEQRIPVYIPRATTAGVPVRVRLNFDVAGGAPSYALVNAFIEPMSSLAVPAIDELTRTGAVALLAGV